jgi:hypothetical protein
LPYYHVVMSGRWGCVGNDPVGVLGARAAVLPISPVRSLSLPA